MKRYLLLSFLLVAACSINGQNQPPVAVNDTADALYNLIKYLNVRSNDFDPDSGQVVKVDTILYDGIALVTYNFVSVKYTGASGFFGLDSLQYVLRDNGDPIMYDTAWVFINVRRKHFETLDINNINAYLGKDANLFWNSFTGLPGFEVPAGGGNHSIFAVIPWLVGYVNSSLKMNASRYWQELPDILYGPRLAGPIMDEQWYSEYDEKWDRLWKVNKTDVEYHINHWEDLNYQPVEVIENWPAHGDTDKGQAFYLAPFVDYNNDGLYNPMDGDYPEIKGDQSIFLMYNLIRPFVVYSQIVDTLNLDELLEDT